MEDDWEDWDSDNFNVPDLLAPNAEQLKRLEDRRMVEESDNKIARQLFGHEEDEDEDLTNYKFKTINQNGNVTIKSIRNKKNTVKKQKENEEKLKERSKKNKEDKAKKLAEKELFGEAEEDEYDNYAAKFDN
jgi:hypothetical protein